MSLFGHQIILTLNTTELNDTQRVARDFRSCSTVVSVGPVLYAAQGPLSVRSLSEMGTSDIMLDIRLSGTAQEIWQSISVIGQLPVKAVTVSSMVGYTGLAVAVKAAEASQLTSRRVKRLLIFASLLPGSLSEQEFANMGMEGHRTHAFTALQNATAANVDGMIVNYKDVKGLRRKCRSMPLLVVVQRPARNYTELMPIEYRNLPGVSEIVSAGAAHALFDAALIGTCGTSWCADLLNKELLPEDTGLR